MTPGQANVVSISRWVKAGQARFVSTSGRMLRRASSEFRGR
jgi:hypothetical protein